MATQGKPEGKVSEDKASKEKMTEEELQEKLKELMAQEVTSNAERFRRRKRSLELTIHNRTSEATLRFQDQYFCSGTWYENFSSCVVPPGKFSKAFVASRSGSLVGVTGGLRFKIEDKGAVKYLMLGFKNPLIRSYKTYIEVTEKFEPAKYGYDNAEDDHHKLFINKGFEVEAKLTAPLEGGNKQVLYVISDAPPPAS